jgi:hypothetical protein
MTRRQQYRGLDSVYFARDDVTGHIKVGFSGDPERRMIGLRSKTGHPVTLLAASVGNPWERARLEYAIQQFARDTLVSGEWFRPSMFLARCINACSHTLPALPPTTIEDAILVRLTLADEAWATSADPTPDTDPRYVLANTVTIRARRHKAPPKPLTYTDTPVWSGDAASYWGEWATLLGAPR